MRALARNSFFPQEVRGGEGGAPAAAPAATIDIWKRELLCRRGFPLLCCLVYYYSLHLMLCFQLSLLPFWVTLPAVEVVCSSPSLSQFCAFTLASADRRWLWCITERVLLCSLLRLFGSFIISKFLLFDIRCRGVWKPRPLWGGTYPPPSTSLVSEFHCKE